MELNYPKHRHPYGIEKTEPNKYRIWICTECPKIFTDEELRKDLNNWGHCCKKSSRCESHIEPYVLDLHSIKIY